MNPLWLIAPIFCYLVEGPTAGVEDVTFWRTLLSAPEDDEGVISGTYAYSAGVATITNEGVTEVGPLTGAYDPEWDAFIAGELI